MTDHTLVRYAQALHAAWTAFHLSVPGFAGSYGKRAFEAGFNAGMKYGAVSNTEPAPNTPGDTE